MSKSELIITVTIEATNTRRYEKVVLGTNVLKFKPSGEPIRHVLRIGNDIGFSKDMNPVFLDTLEIQPRMVEKTNP